jgi:hypothetical protein
VFNDSEFIPLTLNRRICKLWASNVVVYEDPGKEETILGVIDPEMMVPATGRTDLDVFAKVYEKNYKLHLIQYELN